MAYEEFEKAAVELETNYPDNKVATDAAKLLRNLGDTTKYRNNTNLDLISTLEKFQRKALFYAWILTLESQLEQIDAYDEAVRGLRKIYEGIKESNPNITWPIIPGFGPIYIDLWAHRMLRSFEYPSTLYYWSIYDMQRPRPVLYYALQGIYEAYKKVNFAQEI